MKPTTKTETRGRPKGTVNKKSRSQKLLRHLLTGRTISGGQAFTRFGIYRLSGIIHYFRGQGFTIEMKMINRKGTKYGVYKLTGTPQS